MNNDILRYGKFLEDEQQEIEGNYIRIRKILYNNKTYIHKMINGKVIEIKEV